MDLALKKKKLLQLAIALLLTSSLILSWTSSNKWRFSSSSSIFFSLYFSRSAKSSSFDKELITVSEEWLVVGSLSFLPWPLISLLSPPRFEQIWFSDTVLSCTDIPLKFWICYVLNVMKSSNVAMLILTKEIEICYATLSLFFSTISLFLAVN